MKLPLFNKKRVGTTADYAWAGLPASGPTGPEQRAAYKSFQELAQSENAFDRIEFLDTKRAEIALKFVRWYLVFVALVIVGVPLFNAFAVDSKEPLDIYKLLAQLGALLGSPLGFVVGYYFKDDKNSGA